MASLKDRLAQNLQRNQQTHDTAPTRPPVGAPPPDEEVRRQVSYVPVSRVTPNPFQPRREFDEEALTALANSIEREGLLQPIVVRPNGAQGYQLISGERRLRAFQRLERAEIPALILPMSDTESATAALQENIKREDLSDFEVSEGLIALRALKAKAGEPTTITALAETLSVSRPALYRYLSFEALPERARQRLQARPRLISGTAARELELWSRGAEGERVDPERYEELLMELLSELEAGELTQAALVWRVKEHLTPSPQRRASQGELSLREGSRTGEWESTERGERGEETHSEYTHSEYTHSEYTHSEDTHSEETDPRPPPPPNSDLSRGEIHFGRWETREKHIKITLNRAALTQTQEDKLRAFIDKLFHLTP